nr:unnamed protein product [Naegleria fowleri]
MSSYDSSNLNQPSIIAERIDHVYTVGQNHSTQISDPYFWLSERENPKVREYLESENEYQQSVLKHTEELQEKLFYEIKNRIKQTDNTVPYRMKDYVYYSKTEDGKQFSIYCRKPIINENEHGNEQVLLDLNELAEELKTNFVNLGIYKVSPSQDLLAYSIDTDGSEYYDLYVKNLNTGKLLRDRIDKSSKIARSFEFSTDSRTVVFTIYDDTHRPYKVFRTKLDIDTYVDERSQCKPIELDNCELLYTDHDEKFFVSVRKTLSEQYVFIDSSSNITSECHYLQANDLETGTFKLFGDKPRKTGLEFSVTHQGDYFYIVHNEGDNVNFKVTRTPITNPCFDTAEDFVPYNEKFYCEALLAFNKHLALFGRSGGVPKLVILDPQRKVAPREVEFPEPSFDLSPSNNKEYDTFKVRISYSSFLTPPTVYDYDMENDKLIVLKQDEVLGGYDKTIYKQEKISAKSRDGVTEIPISIVYKKRSEQNPLVLDGDNPLLLYAYGSYGACIDAYFSYALFSLLDRGFVYALAAIRGGAENGRNWYLDGKLLKKKNTFNDFIDCAEYLINEKYTKPEKLAIYGGSAGGLLIGAVVNMRPELFKAAILQVPFVDVINTMCDATLPLTVTEYEEWGCPLEKEYFDYMKSYSPYDNIENDENIDKPYPSILIDQSFNDTRVNYWEGAKYVARLRHFFATKKKNQNTSVILCKTNMSQGHSGSAGRYDRYKETAFRYAFLIDQLIGIME